MAWFWFILVILSNLIWFLIYDACKKIIITYKNIIMKSDKFTEYIDKIIDESEKS